MDRRSTIFAGLAALAALLAVAAGFAVIGPPWSIRAERLDARRSGDLRHLASAIEGHWMRYGALPDELAALRQAETRPLRLADPVSGNAYEYEQTGDGGFRLCARFATTSREEDFWRHHPGRNCYAFTAQDQPRERPALVPDPAR